MTTITVTIVSPSQEEYTAKINDQATTNELLNELIEALKLPNGDYALHIEYTGPVTSIRDGSRLYVINRDTPESVRIIRR